MRPRALLSIACLIGLGVASVRPQPLTLPFINRTSLHRQMTILPDSGVWWPDYPRFLQSVRSRTRRGDTVAIVDPTMRWDAGYSYAYYRASYFLAGREVLPILTPDDRRLPDNFNRAEYLAIWHNRVPQRASIVFAGNGGVLVRR